MLRVIAGALKGRRLQVPDWPGLRPTSDRLRETLFNVLAPRIGGARFLDAYAGTGAVGIEALSRGAAHVTFVELDPRAIQLIQTNLRKCGVSDRHAIIRGRVGRSLSLPIGSFDLAVLDPPYDESDLTAAIAALEALIAPGGLLVLEHARRRESPESVGQLTRTRVLRSGDSALSFYSRLTIDVADR